MNFLYVLYRKPIAQTDQNIARLGSAQYIHQKAQQNPGLRCNCKPVGQKGFCFFRLGIAYCIYQNFQRGFLSLLR